MFQPKLIVTDLDGTALRRDKTISPATTEAFLRFQKKGIPIAIATARYLAGAKPFVHPLYVEYLILTDGTLVFHKDKLIYSNALSLEQTNLLLSELIRFGYASHIAIPTTLALFRYLRGIQSSPQNLEDGLAQFLNQII